MRGKSSSKQGRINRVGVSMEKDKVDKAKEEPHLSGAYIRSLVKHLTSTRTKDLFDGDAGLPKALNTNGECFSDHNTMQQELLSPPPSPPQPPPQHKKQVRRRQHTSRPYQERLLNMAEARREIVTALKFHRASMKQQESATQKHPQSEQSPPPQPSTASAITTTATVNNYLEHCSVPYHWPISTIAPPPLPPPSHENLNFILPNQTLGLNLNFQDFKDLETHLYHDPLSINSSSASASSSSSSSPSTSSSAAIEEMAAGVPDEVAAVDLHHAMDDEEMEEIRSLGKQHQMEWNDTVNLMTSARWFKFLKTMEIEGEVAMQKDDGYNPFDQVIEFPPWLINANENLSSQHHFDDQFSHDYSQDPSLPCMEIGEIEGVYGEWLA